MKYRLERVSIRPESRIGEREAPDGEEDELSTASAQVPTIQESDIRVPNWINESPVAQLQVLFNDRAIASLQSIKGSEVSRFYLLG